MSGKKFIGLAVVTALGVVGAPSVAFRAECRHFRGGNANHSIIVSTVGILYFGLGSSSPNSHARNKKAAPVLADAAKSREETCPRPPHSQRPTFS